MRSLLLLTVLIVQAFAYKQTLPRRFFDSHAVQILKQRALQRKSAAFKFPPISHGKAVTFLPPRETFLTIPTLRPTPPAVLKSRTDPPRYFGPGDRVPPVPSRFRIPQSPLTIPNRPSQDRVVPQLPSTSSQKYPTVPNRNKKYLQYLLRRVSTDQERFLSDPQRVATSRTRLPRVSNIKTATVRSPTDQEIFYKQREQPVTPTIPTARPRNQPVVPAVPRLPPNIATDRPRFYIPRGRMIPPVPNRVPIPQRGPIDPHRFPNVPHRQPTAQDRVAPQSSTAAPQRNPTTPRGNQRYLKYLLRSAGKAPRVRSNRTSSNIERQLNRRQFELQRAFNNFDKEKIGSVYAEHAVLLPVASAAKHGRKEIAEYVHQMAVSSRGPEFHRKCKFVTLETQNFGENVAFTRGVYIVYQQPPEVIGYFMRTWEKIDGKWFITNSMFNSLGEGY